MKGVELPINALIVIAIAVIVLIAIVAMFYPAFSSGSGTVSMDMAKSQACRALVEGNGCNVNTWSIPVYNFDANKDKGINPGSETLAAFPTCNLGGNDNLARLCACYYQLTTEPDCRKICNC